MTYQNQLTMNKNFASYKATEEKISKIDERLTVLQKKRDKIYKSKKYSWIDVLLHPLAKELSVKLGYKYWDIMGPFGLGCETSIWLWPTKADHTKDSKQMVSLTVRPVLHEIDGNYFGFEVQTHESINSYPKGSIGELNGFNHKFIMPPKDATIEWFLEKLEK